MAETDLVCTVVARDFLAEDEDVIVTNHLLLHGHIERITHGHLGRKRGVRGREEASGNED